DAGLVVPENSELIPFFIVLGVLLGAIGLIISLYFKKRT
ncbi:MAG: hypothetical protein QG557_388, partial [Pseudomonadota bacterium]|nr:hypothetical protein [Pseudomonadota bacterium]